MSMPLPAHAPAPTIIGEQTSDFDIDIFDSLDAAAPAWRRLEARGVSTPYQRLDWMATYLAAFAPAGRVQVLLLSHNGAPAALFPFHIVNRFGVRIAQTIGMPISNGDAPVFDPGFSDRLGVEALRAAFRRLPADLVNFHCVAPRIGGRDNPLLGFAHAPAPDHFYFNELAPGDIPYIEQALPHKRRTNIRRSQRRLSEGFGEVRLKAAQSEQEVRDLLAIFLDQRGRRFAAMGVENVFARAEFRAFFERLAIESLSQPRPALRIHALYAGERVIATSLGAYGPSHYSQYINSTDDGEPSRFSLMGVTLSLLVEELRQEGIVGLDMGLGDFDYKLDWTHKTVVYDIVIANSALGLIARPVLTGLRRGKRAIKQTPALWRAARAVQGLKLKLKRQK